MWFFSGIYWDLCLWGGHTASTKCPPSRGTASLRVARRTLDSALLLGIRPSHQSTTRYGAAPFQPLRSLFLVLVEFKPSPFSFLPFWFSPCGRFHFSAFSPAAFGEGCFSRIHTPPAVSILSPHAKAAPCSPRLLSPQVHLSTPCTC